MRRISVFLDSRITATSIATIGYAITETRFSMDWGSGTIGITERYDIYADFKRFETGRLAIGLKDP